MGPLLRGVVLICMRTGVLLDADQLATVGQGTRTEKITLATPYACR
jgi:hypothetical protein